MTYRELNEFTYLQRKHMIKTIKRWTAQNRHEHFGKTSHLNGVKRIVHYLTHIYIDMGQVMQ